MKEDTGVTSRSQRPRIDIGRSLSIGKSSTKATDAPQSTQPTVVSKSSEQSADAAKISLSKIFDGITIPESTSSATPPSQPIATGREAAKSQYLKQSATSPIQSTEVTASEDADLQTEPDIGAVLQEIQSRLGQYEIADGEDTPTGDSVETLKPYAEKYVAFLEQTGQSFSGAEREAKIKEVTEFYSAPTRQGRLQSLVQDI